MENESGGIAQTTTAKKRKRSNVRPQYGSIRRRHGAWHWDYYAADGKRKLERVASTADVRSMKEVAEVINRIITQRGPALLSRRGDDAPRYGTVTIADFAKDSFLPWAKKELRPATYNGYSQMWNQHLLPHFGNRKLHDYLPYHATEFLGSLVTRGLSKNTISHVRALMSGIFAHAVAKGHLSMNPIQGAKLLHKPKQGKKPLHYTLAEMRTILAALDSDKHARDHAIMALAIIGMRRAEIMGAKWADIDWFEGTLLVQRSAWMGTVADGAKNDRSVRKVTLGSNALHSLKRWREVARKIAEERDPENKRELEFLFENEAGRPLDLGLYSTRVMRPKFKDLELPWKAFHAGRRGASTEMRRFAHGETTAFHFGHSIEVANADYDKGRPDATKRAALRYDATLSGKEQKRSRSGQ